MKLLLLLGVLVSCVASWSHNAQGEWGGVCQTSKRQSPIDINHIKKTVYYGDGIETFGGLTTIKKKVENVHGVKFEMTEELKINMPKDWPVGHTKGLEVLQLHFHWGKSGEDGSEHALFGKHYKGEAHLVTRNLDQDDEEASDYLAVFGVFLETTSNVDESHTDATAAIQDVMQGTTEAFNLDHVFSPKTESIFTYEGGLTTPDCTAFVFWQVLEKPITLTVELMDLLRKVGVDENYEENHRELQDLNGRHITHRMLNQPYTSPAEHGSETCKVDCRAAQQTCMWSMSGAAAAVPSLALLFIALINLV